MDTLVRIRRNGFRDKCEQRDSPGTDSVPRRYFRSPISRARRSTSVGRRAERNRLSLGIRATLIENICLLLKAHIYTI